MILRDGYLPSLDYEFLLWLSEVCGVWINFLFAPRSLKSKRNILKNIFGNENIACINCFPKYSLGMANSVAIKVITAITIQEVYIEGYHNERMTDPNVNIVRSPKFNNLGS